MTQTKGECFLKMSDDPQFSIPNNSTFVWNWLSVGVVFDVCNGMAIKAMGIIGATFSGKVVSGDAEFDKPK